MYGVLRSQFAAFAGFSLTRNYVAGIMDQATLQDVARGLPLTFHEVSTDFVAGEGI
jgi:hypothetical protein